MVAIEKFQRDWKYDASDMRDMINASLHCMRVVVGGAPLLFDHSRVLAPADVAARTA
jgi:hypothetical protein